MKLFIQWFDPRPAISDLVVIARDVVESMVMFFRFLPWLIGATLCVFVVVACWPGIFYALGGLLIVCLGWM